MADFILFKNKKTNGIKNHDISKYNKKDIHGIMVECNSKILGKFYLLIKYKTYKKWYSEIEEVDLRYSFLNGTAIEDEDYDELSIEYQCKYKDLGDFLTRISEIVVSEEHLNDMFWVHAAFYEYHYHNFHIKVKLKTKNKKKKMSIPSFYNMIHFQTPEIKDHLNVKKDTKEWSDCKELKIKSGRTTYQLVHHFGILVKLNKHIKNLKSIDMLVNVYLTDEGLDFDKMKKRELEDNIYSQGSYKIEPNKLFYLFAYPMLDYILGIVYEDCNAMIETKVKARMKNEKKKVKMTIEELKDLCIKS